MARNIIPLTRRDDGILYVVADGKMYMLQKGTGDDLLPEDIRAGYTAYVNWYEGRLLEWEFAETGDGGMLLLEKEPENDLMEVLDAALDEIGVPEETTIYVL